MSRSVIFACKLEIIAAGSLISGGEAGDEARSRVEGEEGNWVDLTLSVGLC